MTMGLLWVARRLPPASFLEVALLLAAGGVVYLGLFVGLALDGEERRFYWTKLRSLIARRRVPAAV
jgi:hypothetical protein